MNIKPQWPGPWEINPIDVPTRCRIKDRPPHLRRATDGMLLLPVRRNGWAYTMVSPEDAWALQHNWYMTPENYVYANLSKKCRYLHRGIAFTAANGLITCPPGFALDSAKQVDHMDRCRLNNTRGNLRLVDLSNNAMNKNGDANIPPGVVWDKDRGMWQVRVKFMRREEFGGRYTDLGLASCIARKLRKKLQRKERAAGRLGESLGKSYV